MLVLAKQTTNNFNIKSFRPGVLIFLLSLDIVDSTHLQREYSQGNQIKAHLIFV